MARITNITDISIKYIVRKLDTEDVKEIYELEIENPIYFEFCPPAASIDSIIKDMKALPPNMTYEDKFYIGFYNDSQLVAIMDLITNYPNKETAFIGFFMMNKIYQNRGIGSDIIKDTLLFLNKEGFSYVRLGYMKGNKQSKSFWIKNGFVPTGVETNNGQGIVVVMQKQIK